MINLMYLNHARFPLSLSFLLRWYLKPTALSQSHTPLQSSNSKTPRPSNHLMISRIRRLLIQHLNRLPSQPREIPLEPQIKNLHYIRSKTLLPEKREAVCVPKQHSLHRQLLDIRGARKLQGLHGRERSRSIKVQSVSVEENFERFGCGGGEGAAEEYRVQLDGAGESVGQGRENWISFPKTQR